MFGPHNVTKGSDTPIHVPGSVRDTVGLLWLHSRIGEKGKLAVHGIALLLCTVILAFVVATPSIADIHYLSPVEDTWVYQYHADTNYGSDTTFGIAIQYMSQMAYSLLKFDLSTLTGQREIATLYLYQMNGGGYGEGPTVLQRDSNNSWNEYVLTWNNFVAGAITPLVQNRDGHSHRGWSSWNFQWSPAYGNLLTLRLAENSSGDQGHNWYSREAEMQYRPHLLVVTTPEGFTGFSDVPADHWSALYSRAIFGAGYTTGYGGTDEFKPDYDVTREQMAAFLVRAKEGEPDEAYCDSGISFTDVPASSWACPYIKRLAELGITSGYGGTTEFKPGYNVTREQMAAFIARAFLGMK